MLDFTVGIGSPNLVSFGAAVLEKNPCDRQAEGRLTDFNKVLVNTKTTKIN